MKQILTLGMIVLGMGISSVYGNSAVEALDKHLIAIDYCEEGHGIGGDLTEEKIQEIIAKGKTKNCTCECNKEKKN